MLPDRLANAACKAISYKAFENMPEVSPSTMDAELSVAISLVKSKRGGGWRRGKKFQRENRVFGALGKDKAYKPEYASVPLAALIIQAQTNLLSNFSARTGGVFFRERSPFKGVSRAQGAQNMLEAMRRMLAARHSSSGFFAACAKAVNMGFYLLSSKFNRLKLPGEEEDARPGSTDINKLSTLINKGLARITPAANGSGRAGFSVATTEADTKGIPGHALERIAQPVWQAAVDDEARFQYSKVQRAYIAAIEDAGITVS